MEFLVSGVVMFVIGAAVATCYWLSYMKARDEGYTRGYEQAIYEEGLRNDGE